jgi:hypothetical protein
MRKSQQFRIDPASARKGRVPLRTSRELAEEFGVTTHAFALSLAHAADAPKPVLVKKGNAHAANWYNPKEVRAWWSKRKEAAAP